MDDPPAQPSDPQALAELGHRYRLTRQLELAETTYRRLLSLEPDHPTGQVDLAMTLLAQGRLAEGFTRFENRRARRWLLSRGLSFPEWRGEDLAGKRLFVFREQGFGDQIMAARFLRHLGAASVTYAGPAPLGRLFSQLGVDYLPVAPDVGDLVIPRLDAWVLPLSIPDRLGVTLDTLDGGAYLGGDRREGSARIGVAWRGEPKNLNDRYRSMPEAEARRLLALPGAISLHPEDTGAADFQDTADIIAGLDLVISVDTSVAHLAGAMGKPVWVLVAAHAIDWHWLRDRSDSPWYASARVFRQAAPGDWASVVDRVVDQVGAAE
jgi:hypothetical protein